jgi:hypothetical protein
MALKLPSISDNVIGGPRSVDQMTKITLYMALGDDQQKNMRIKKCAKSIKESL